MQISKLIGMGFDGAATFSGKHNGVQTLLKSNSPHSIFVHCHCHLLQLACVQAANSTPGIKHVYSTLTTLLLACVQAANSTTGIKYVYSTLTTLLLACVQAAISTPGIKHVYSTLTTLWKFFQYSPKTSRISKIGKGSA